MTMIGNTAKKPVAHKDGAKDKAGFELTVIEAIGEYAVDDVLTNVRQVGDYIRQHAIDTADSEEVKAKLAAATNAQIVEVVKSVDVSDVDADDETDSVLVRYVRAVIAAPFAVDTSHVPTVADLRTMKEASPYKYGQKVSTDTVKDMDGIVEAAKIADAGAVSVARDLERDLGKEKEGNYAVLDLIPPIGSRYRPSSPKGNKAPVGYKLPDNTDKNNKLPVWNGPWDYSENKVSGEAQTAKNRFVTIFVAAKIGEGLTERLNHIRDAKQGINRTDAKGAAIKKPEDIAKLQAAGDGNGLIALESEIAYQFSKRERVTAGAFELIQAKRGLEAYFDGSSDRARVKVVLHGLAGIAKPTAEQVTQACRARKPYQLVTLAKQEDGSDLATPSIPFEQSKLKLAYRRLQSPESKANATLKPGDLLAANKKGKKGPESTVPASTAKSRITGIDQAETVMSELWGYMSDNKLSTLRTWCNDPVHGPSRCALIERLYDTFLEAHNIPGVVEKAIQFETLVGQQQGDESEKKLKKAG